MPLLRTTSPSPSCRLISTQWETLKGERSESKEEKEVGVFRLPPSPLSAMSLVVAVSLCNIVSLNSPIFIVPAATGL